MFFLSIKYLSVSLSHFKLKKTLWSPWYTKKFSVTRVEEVGHFPGSDSCHLSYIAPGDRAIRQPPLPPPRDSVRADCGEGIGVLDRCHGFMYQRGANRATSLH